MMGSLIHRYYESHPFLDKKNLPAIHVIGMKFVTFYRLPYSGRPAEMDGGQKVDERPGHHKHS